MTRAASTRLRLEQFEDFWDGVLGFDEGHRAAATFEFDFAFGQGFFADGQTDGETDQFGILELEAGPFVAVVQDDVHSLGHEFGIDFFGELHDGAAGGDGQRGETNGVRGNGNGPDDAVLVVGLFDDGLHGAGNADAIGPHDGGLLLAGFVEEQGVEGFAVFDAEFEKVADLDGAADGQGLAAMGARFAGLDQAQIAPLSDPDVAGDFDLAQMESIFVGAGGHAGGALQRFIGVNGQVFYADGAQAAGMGAEGRKYLLRFGGAEGSGAQSAGELGLVELMVAAQKDENGFIGDDVNQGFDLALRRDLERSGGQGINGEDARRGEFFGSGGRGGGGLEQGHAAGGFFRCWRRDGRPRRKRFRSRRFRRGP